MPENMLEYERELFFLLNGSDSATMDHFMWLVSNKFVWIPWIICFLIIVLYRKNRLEAALVILAIVLVITVCDQVTSSLIKPMFARFRPTHHPDFMNEVKTVLNYRGGRYGFVSGHAANAFGCAVFLTLLFRNRFFTFSILFFALINAYSRIYLGVHFISDIVGGTVVGIAAGLAIYRLYVPARKRIMNIPDSQAKATHLTAKEIFGISLFFWITLLMLLIFNNQLITLLA
jgi:undecaprenyl-diphosphatase